MRIMVLNDGETYTSAEGCLLLEIDVPDHEEIPDSVIKEAAEALADPSVSFTILSAYNGEVEVEPIARF